MHNINHAEQQRTWTNLRRIYGKNRWGIALVTCKSLSFHFSFSCSLALLLSCSALSLSCALFLCISLFYSVNHSVQLNLSPLSLSFFSSLLIRKPISDAEFSLQDFYRLRLDFAKSFWSRKLSILIDWLSRSCWFLSTFTVRSHFFIFIFTLRFSKMQTIETTVFDALFRHRTYLI